MALDKNEASELAGGVRKLFNQKDRFIVVGFTGRTGSGCSTAASILSKTLREIATSPIACPIKDNEQRKHAIVLEWSRQHWQPFTVINVSSIIFCIISLLEKSEVYTLMPESMTQEQKDCAVSATDFVRTNLEKYSKIMLNPSHAGDDQDVSLAYEFYFVQLPKYAEIFKEALSQAGIRNYISIMQLAGDNIRRSGRANSSNAEHDQIFFLPELINKMIKLGRRYCKINGRPGYFAIDAIRNPFEAEFFKGRYSAFYLIAITTDESCRNRRLHTLNFTQTDIKAISEKEYPKKDNMSGYRFLASQHIMKCLELADIIIENPDVLPNREKQHLSDTLVKYISLIQHPGLITPNRVERCMQIAITARVNSGCISRQVGAAVTDSSYSIRAIGWNSVPEGQVPCSLRNLKRLRDGSDPAAFSDFERDLPEESFKEVFNSLPHFNIGDYSLQGRPLSYCFKSTYNKAKDDKNQVHTRAVHAEENAFLQIGKYGGPGIKGGILFSTASPCELCSKMAVQLGVSEIYYIDPYPGIAGKHVLSCGSNAPKLRLFTGAVGRAYIQLYQPLVPLKDELSVLFEDNIAPSNESQ